MAKFEEVQANHGVDTLKPGQEWMMVPLGGSNLVGLSDGTGFSVAEEKGGKRGLTVAGVPARQVWGDLSPLGSFFRPNTSFFRVTSHGSGGETHIEAKKGSITVSLLVSVHPRRSFDVAFYFLQDRDKKGTITARTSFAPADAGGWLDGLNDVYGPQANIWFKNVKAEVFPMEDLGTAVGTPQDIVKFAEKKKAAGASIVIFLAGSTIVNVEKDFPLGFFDIPNKLIVVKDQVVKQWGDFAAPMLKTIAHEIGHFLNDSRGFTGTSHDDYVSNGYTSDIMNTMNGNDIKIAHQRVLNWNPW